jgi:hypothetical protein
MIAPVFTFHSLLTTVDFWTLRTLKSVEIDVSTIFNPPVRNVVLVSRVSWTAFSDVEPVFNPIVDPFSLTTVVFFTLVAFLPPEFNNNKPTKSRLSSAPNSHAAPQ